jgi:hypothetical protein
VLEKLTGREVANLAVNAHAVDQSLLLWGKEGQALQPKTVVLGYAVDKFMINTFALRDLPKPFFSFDTRLQSYRLEGQPVVSLDSPQLEATLSDSTPLRTVQLVKWLKRKVDTKLHRDVPPHFADAASLNNYLLKNLNDSVKQSGARLLVVFIGECNDGVPGNMRIEETVMASCKENGIQCLDLAAAMRGPDYGSYYGANCHWSERGHHFAAEQIATALGAPH